MAFARMTRNVVVVLGLGLLSGCATPSAPDFRGRWKPINQFAETPQAIPLHQAYVYQASPVDGTLKGMLGRWAKDSRLGLSYLHPNDYTLHAPVAQIRSYDIAAAAVLLTEAYAHERLRVSVEGGQIVVRQASSAVDAGSSAPSTSAD